jgi:hypothetical protein
VEPTIATPRRFAHLEGCRAFLRGGARPPVDEVIRFIDGYTYRRSGQLRWGIEPIAKVLGIAPSSYQAAKSRPPSVRAIRDAEFKAEIFCGCGLLTDVGARNAWSDRVWTALTALSTWRPGFESVGGATRCR